MILMFKQMMVETQKCLATQFMLKFDRKSLIEQEGPKGALSLT